MSNTYYHNKKYKIKNDINEGKQEDALKMCHRILKQGFHCNVEHHI